MNLRRLHCNFDRFQSIPVAFGNLTNLQVLDTMLMKIWIVRSINRINRTIELPATLPRLASLETLHTTPAMLCCFPSAMLSAGSLTSLVVELNTSLGDATPNHDLTPLRQCQHLFNLTVHFTFFEVEGNDVENFTFPREVLTNMPYLSRLTLRFASLSTTRPGRGSAS